MMIQDEKLRFTMLFNQVRACGISWCTGRTCSLANEVKSEGKLPCTGVSLLLTRAVCTSSRHTALYKVVYFSIYRFD